MKVGLLALFFAFLLLGVAEAAEKYFVGTQVCAQCHEEEYATYRKHSKKAHSFDSIVKMRDRLDQEEVRKCYRCHTTGYGKPGGFKDETTTPGLKNVGCEACHGPGSLHVESESTEDIINSAEEIRGVCGTCHTKEIIEAFGVQPLLHGGAH